jgi:hypothetical protein
MVREIDAGLRLGRLRERVQGNGDEEQRSQAEFK